MDAEKDKPVMLSKKAMKRKAKREAMIKRRQERKRAKKEKKKALREDEEKKKKTLKKTKEEGGGKGDEGNTSEGVLRESKKERRARYEASLVDAPVVVFDLGFEEHMTDKEKRSMCQQLMYCYGANKRCDALPDTPLSGPRRRD